MWDEPIPISALQPFVYCPRQCALIHVESVWEDNLYTRYSAPLSPCLRFLG